jgi:hypothetical protein
MALQQLVTRDSRCFVVKGWIWRLAKPSLSQNEKPVLISKLMRFQRAVKTAERNGDVQAETAALRYVEAVKHALGERGAVRWTNGDVHLNRHPSHVDRLATFEAHVGSRGAS